MHLINPLDRFQFEPLPNNFPKCLNILDFRVEELGEEYALRHVENGIFGEKVAVLNDPGAGFVLLKFYLDDGLWLGKSGDDGWKLIEYSGWEYDDLIAMEGKFYVVDKIGRLVMVNHVDLNATVVVEDSIADGHEKFLVNSNGELLLVDLYLRYKDIRKYSEKIKKFEVFRLEENVGKWVKVRDLRGRMLFFANYRVFSLSASEIFGDRFCRGNCINFDDQCYYRASKSMSRGVGVYDLETGIIHRHVSYSKMFGPPPNWISSSASAEVRVDQNSDTMLSINRLVI